MGVICVCSNYKEKDEVELPSEIVQNQLDPEKKQRLTLKHKLELEDNQDGKEGCELESKIILESDEEIYKDIQIQSKNSSRSESLTKNYNTELLKIEVNFDDQNFDYYNHSKNIFNIINEIRINPNIHLSALQKIVSLIEKHNGEFFLKLSNIEKDYAKFSSEGFYYFTNSLDAIGLLNFLNRRMKDSFNEPLIWSEKLYATTFKKLHGTQCLHDENSVNPTPKTTNSTYDSKERTKELSVVDKLEFRLEGLFHPKLTVYLALLELSLNQLANLLTHEYEFSTVVSHCTINYDRTSNYFLFDYKTDNNM